MINLARNPDTDKYIKEELYLAGLDPIPEKGEGEVPYTIVAKVGKWKFTRAWYYWMVSIPKDEDGLNLDVAIILHNTSHPTKEIMGNVIRSGGHCGCPSPIEQAQPVYGETLNEKIVALGYKLKTIKIGDIEKTFPDLNFGEINELCNKGELQLERFITNYHVDDQIGLNKLVEFLREYKNYHVVYTANGIRISNQVFDRKGSREKWDLFRKIDGVKWVCNNCHRDGISNKYGYWDGKRESMIRTIGKIQCGRCGNTLTHSTGGGGMGDPFEWTFVKLEPKKVKS